MALSDWRAMTLARLQYWLNKTIAVIRKEKTHYAISSTAAATAVKVASSTGFVLVNGAKAIVKFQYKNTAENPQLNIENTGARPICFRGEPVSSRLLEANREYLFVFDGTVYNLVGQENGDDVAELSDSLTNVINGTSPVALADNFTSENAQQSAQEFILRTSGGNASISDGDAWVSLIMGNRVHNGYIPEDIQMTVTPAQREHAQDMVISAEIDKSVFRTAVSETSGTITFIYNGTSEAWNITPLTYGITVSGSPVDGDTITVTYVLEDRGTIVVATPTAMKSTGWNLFNSTLGYAYVTKYSEEYGFKIGGSYSSLSFSETPGGATVPISVVDSFFTVPSDGYVYVAGSGSNTYILNTWSDWQEGYSGSFESYSETTINIASVMSSYFPNGLLRVGDVRDEINFNSMIAISRIERLAYTPSNIAAVIASGRAYEADTNYIYVVRASEVTNPITVSAAYTASDHGNEFFVGTSVPVYAEVLYGANLKNKLERDVLTISQQTLSSGEKTQVRTNIGAASASDLSDLNSNMTTALSRISALENLPIKIVGNQAWHDYHDCNDCLNPNYGYQVEWGSLHSPGDYYMMWVSKTSWGLIQFANHYYDVTFKIRVYSRDNNHWSDWQTLTSGHKKMEIRQLTGTTGTGGAVGNMEFSLSSYPGLTAIIPIKTIVNNWMLTWEGLFGGTYHVISARNFTTGAWASGETITFTALLIYD